jgi:hypothetical protein
MKTVKLKLKNKYGCSNKNIVNAHVFDGLSADFENGRESVKVLIVPPAARNDCACLIFADYVRGIKSYTYRERDNTPYINLEKDDIEEILKRLPIMSDFHGFSSK